MSKSASTSSNSETSLASLDTPGKGLRNDPKSEGGGGGGGGGVFRLDALAPGAAGSGADPFAAPKPKLSQSLIFFLLLVIAGGAILFFMRQIGIGPMASLATMKAPDYDVTKDLKGKTGDHKRVLKDLSESSVKTQVPIEQVQKNPFKLSDMINTTPQPGEDSEAAARALTERARRDADARSRQIEGILSNLKVHAILGGSGSNPVARINDQAVRLGDTIEELLTVSAMKDRSVDLECDGKIYTISLDDDAMKPKPAKGGSRKK